MERVTFQTEFIKYDSDEFLTDNLKSLLKSAVEIREKAYAIYSKFRVGAVIELENGKIIQGNNQENAAYPSGLCAERVAIYQAGAIYPNEKIKRIVISARSENQVLKQPIPPCGACRQSILEYEQKQKSPIEVYFSVDNGEVIKVNSISDLLPFAFSKDFL